MTTKTLTGAYSAGYTLAATYSNLDLTKSASVSGAGGAAGVGPSPGPAVSAGSGGFGVDLPLLGQVFNAGSVTGGAGGYGYAFELTVYAGGNGGAGMVLAAGGGVTNTGDLRGGVGGAGGSFYTPGGLAAPPSEFAYGGVGGTGAMLESGSVINSGTIAGGDGGSHFGAGGVGVYLRNGGTITGERGVIAGGAGGVGGQGGTAIYLLQSGAIAIAKGRVDGGAGGGGGYGYGGAAGGGGVEMHGGGTLSNVAGTIEGGAGGKGGFFNTFAVYPVWDEGMPGQTGGSGVSAGGVATVVNGGFIHGGAGGDGGNGSGTSGNFYAGGGAGGAGGDGVALLAGGDLTNTGTIVGGVGGAGGSAGAGHYAADGADGVGVLLGAGGDVTNGSASDTKALIEGGAGVQLTGAGTVVNFATIKGEGGYSVQLTSSSAQLLAEAGSTFIGQASVGGGRLEVAAGMASFMGGVVTAGLINGAGVLALIGGVSTFNAGASLTVAGVAVSGAKTVVDVAVATLDYAHLWTQTSGSLSVASGDRINFSGTGDSFSGTIAGAGVVAFIGGSDTLSAVRLTAASAVINGAAVTLSNNIALAGATLTTTTAHLVIAAGGATLNGGGVLELTNQASNAVTGATTAATLTNANDTIEGAGELGGGQMVLINDAVIEGDDPLALTLNTGAAVIANTGLVEAKGVGGVVIASAIDNTGVLAAVGGDLTVDQAVTGTGSVKINAATADFAAAFSENVVFTGAKGGLELADAPAYAGTITGFSTAGTTSLDLEDILFADAPTWSYSGTAASGVLTVKDTDGHAAHIALSGDYLNSTFILSAAPGSGTTVVDPDRTAHTAGPVRPIHAFVQAMAGVARAHAMASPAAAPWRAPAPTLARPAAQVA